MRRPTRFVRPVAHNQPDRAHQHGPTANLDDLGEGSAHDYRPKGGSDAKTASKAPRKCEYPTSETVVFPWER